MNQEKHSLPDNPSAPGGGNRRRTVLVVLAFIALAGIVVMIALGDDTDTRTEPSVDPTARETVVPSSGSANSQATDSTLPNSISEVSPASTFPGTDGPISSTDTDDSPAEATPGCVTMTAGEVAAIVGQGIDTNWTVAATFTPTVAERTAIPATNGFYSQVIYLEGEIDGSGVESFVFVSGSDDLTSPDAQFVGADEITREFFLWGTGIDLAGPAGEAITLAVDSVGTPCLPK